jgi:hypothetical protein
MGRTLLLLASLACLIVPTWTLDTNVRIVRLSYLNSDVQMDRGDAQGYQRAILNTPVVQGTRLWTRGDEALAEVEFEDGSTVRLTPGTTVIFKELVLRGSGEKVTSVDLDSGTAYFDLRGQMGEFRATFGGEQISSSHPARFRVYGGDHGQFKVADYKGNLDVRTSDKQIALHGGETLEFSDAGQYNVVKSIAEGSYDNWNKEREAYSGNVASARSADYYSSGFSPTYSYGLADLAYYGNYFYAPGWGWTWRPYYLGAAWNPFMDGAWTWYPQLGYLWISPYPWGWMPYRYGTWNFVPGYGWCWMPASVWNSWVPVTAVNHPPVNWQPLRPPAAPPKPGAAGLVPVGRTWGTVYPPGSVRPIGTALLPSGNTASAGPQGWAASAPVIHSPSLTASNSTAASASSPPAPRHTPRTSPLRSPGAGAATRPTMSGGSHSWGGHSGSTASTGHVGGHR